MLTNFDEAWLRLTIEPPLDPALPICDPHHHLWDRPNNRYLLPEFLLDTGAGHHIVKTVYIECLSMYKSDGPEAMRPVGETEFVQGMTNQTAGGQHGVPRVAAGIVGFADLRLGAAVAPVLEAHLAASDRLRGIRHITAWKDDSEPQYPTSAPKLLSDPKFREGFACLREYGLSFDAWLFHTQLPELLDLARAFPDTTIILDHIGTPLGIGPYAGKRREVLRKWKSGIVALAACPNVFIKLGGMGMAFYGFGWNERATPPDSAELSEVMAPYYLWCIEQFGAERCMFESNFPVDKISYSYNVVWNAFKRLTRDFSPEERMALFHDTAVKVYRL